MRQHKSVSLDAQHAIENVRAFTNTVRPRNVVSMFVDNIHVVDYLHFDFACSRAKKISATYPHHKVRIV